MALVLEDLRAQCIKNPLFSQPGGAPPDDPGMAAAVRELENLQSKLVIVNRDLENDIRQTAWTRERAIFETREQRYRMIQSASSREENARRVLHLAAGVQKLLSDILAKSMTISIADAIAASGGGKIEKIMKAKAKGEDYKPDGGDVADQLSVTVIMIIAIISAVVQGLKKSGRHWK